MPKMNPTTTAQTDLATRVVTILERARSQVVRAVNSQMVIAYWLIGREMVQALQGGDERAAYGTQLLESLSEQLGARYGRGYSVTNLRNFRLFYQAFADRQPIHQTLSDELAQAPTGPDNTQVQDDLAAALQTHARKGFSAALSWSHYRALSTVSHPAERQFLEVEAEKAGWSLTVLERQIHTQLFARLFKSRDKAGVLALATQGQQVDKPMDVIRHPYVLDFLDLPDAPQLHESDLEAAIIDRLQPFLLELGKGFAFVGRQYRIGTELSHFYIDLVFYNYLLKCFVLVDLKMGRLTHQDVGQMDMYVRMFDDLQRSEGDNPSVGLILCAERDEVVARYSALHESQQLFASKYQHTLPSVEQLQSELLRERALIEAHSVAAKTPTTPSKPPRSPS